MRIGYQSLSFSQPSLRTRTQRAWFVAMLAALIVAGLLFLPIKGAKGIEVPAGSHVYTWDYSQETAYEYDSSLVTIVDGKAQLKALSARWWGSTYDSGNGNSYGYACSVDSADNVYLAGDVQANGNHDVLLLKYDSDGNLASGWPKTFDRGGADDFAGGMTIDSSGNIWVAGWSGGVGSRDLIVVKFDANGNLFSGFPWVFNQGADEEGHDIAIDRDGNVAVCGQTDINGDIDFLTLYYTASGTMISNWPQIYDYGGGDDFANGIAVDNAKRIVVTGSGTGGASGNDIVTIRYYPFSTVVSGWPKVHNRSGASDDGAYDVCVDASTNVYVAGYATAGVNVVDTCFLKYSPDGTIDPTTPKYYNPGGKLCEANGIARDSDGNVILSGYYLDAPAGDATNLAVKYTPSGSLFAGWPRTHKGSGSWMGYGCVVDSYNNVYVSGYATSGGEQNCSLQKFSPGTYSSGRPSVTAKNSATYLKLEQFLDTAGDGNQGEIHYQISRDGSTWYYIDGKDQWAEVTDRKQGYTAPQINNKIVEFGRSYGSGDFHMRAILVSDGTQKAEVTETAIRYDPATTWYMAEGYTGDNNYPGESFDTYVLVQNPGEETSQIKATFMKPGGVEVEKEYEVPGGSRFTIHVDEVPGCENTSVSTMVESTNNVPVICERSVYFNYYGRVGGHDVLAVTKPEELWYLPEGYTGDDNYPGEAFDTYVLIQNPNDELAMIRAMFQFSDGGSKTMVYTVLPHERFTIHVDEVPDCENKSVSTVISSENEVPIIVERSVYFNYHGRIGGHASTGIVQPYTDWYLAEGYTADGLYYPEEAFDTYILIQNPNIVVAEVKCSFMKPGGEVIEKYYSLEPARRFTIHVDEIPGLEATSVSTRVQTTNGAFINCERAVYFNYRGKTGGHDCVAVREPGLDWYLPEGYTGDNNYPGEAFDTWILIQNPSEDLLEVQATFMREGADVVVQDYQVAAHERYTIHLDEVPGCENASISTLLESKNGVKYVAERAVYFSHFGREGGHDSVGFDP